MEYKVLDVTDKKAMMTYIHAVDDVMPVDMVLYDICSCSVPQNTEHVILFCSFLFF